MVLKVSSAQLSGFCGSSFRDEIGLMELEIANETWGFMSPSSGRAFSRLELESEGGSHKDDDEEETGDDGVDNDEYSSNSSLFSTVSKKSKKRVQFQADDNLELVYEIPPRGHYSSSEESDCDDSSDDENDDLSSDSDSSSDSSEISFSSPSVNSKVDSPKQPTSLNLVSSHSSSFYNNNSSPARGSYSVFKSKDKGPSVVAKITGMTPFHAKMAAAEKIKSSARREKSVKRTRISNSGNGSSEEKPKTTTRRVKGTRKRASLKKVDVGKNAVGLKRPKENKTLPNVSPRRCSSAYRIPNNRKGSLSRSLSPSKALPPARPKSEMSMYPVSKTQTSSTRLSDQKEIRVGDSLKNLSLGKVYTVDGFIFPRDPVDQISKRSTVELNPPNSRDISSQSTVQRKRCLSWKMANATFQNPVVHTPCILPLWESIQSVSLTSKPSVKTKF